MSADVDGRPNRRRRRAAGLRGAGSQVWPCARPFRTRAGVSGRVAGATPLGRLRTVTRRAFMRPAQGCWRNSSMGTSAALAGVAQCQKVQPLQAGRPCTQRADLVDRADALAERERAVGAHHGLAAPALVGQRSRRARAGRPRPAAEGDARLAALGRRAATTSAGPAATTRGDARPRRVGIGRVALDADEAAAEPLGDRAGGAGAEEGVEHDVAGLASRPASRGAAAPPASASGAACARRASFSRSPPVQSGMNQSERICRSSLQAFMAS